MSQQFQMPVLQREMLKEAMFGALTDIPGAVALYVFGSSASGTSDTYSDIDLQLHTTSLRESLSALHRVIHRVGRVQLEWMIHSDERSWAATLLFDAASPYHKIDLGFIEVNPGRPSEGPEQGVLVWKQEPAPAFPARSSVPPYSPNSDSLDYWVIGQLLGMTRYAKARNRQQVATCWRFASSLVNSTMTMWYMHQVSPEVPFHRPLTTHEYLALDRVLSQDQRDRLLGSLDFSSARQMDHAVLDMTGALIDTFRSIVGRSSRSHQTVDLLHSFLLAELSHP
ncbi:MAG TPA: hypothetical protein VGR29_02475 [Thermomicrobiales bacterium]|nr:hypothetical protein [Thermomicrobiales bacterium]